MKNNSVKPNQDTDGLRLELAQTQPVLVYLLIAFGWSWLFWFAAILLRPQNNLLLMLVVFIGGYGPAIGGILTLGLKNGLRFEFSLKRLLIMFAGAALIFALMAARYLVGHIPGYEALPTDLSISVPIVAAALMVSLLGGWVISSACSRNAQIKERMVSILPARLSVGWTLLSICVFPALLLLSWGAALLLDMPVEYPALWGQPAAQLLPLVLLSLTLTALARGGNEEPGWRGMLQPQLQTKISPLAAALVVSLFWSLWHLPLYLNGFYSVGLVEGMLGGGIYRLFLAIFMAWLYNRTGGNVLLLVLFHASLNVMIDFFPTNDLILIILWLIACVLVVVKERMYRRTPAPFRQGG